MATRFNNCVVTAVAVAIACLGNCQAGFAAAQSIEPFLCAQSDGSIANWVNVQGHRAIGVTVRETGDQGGGKFVGLSGVAGNSSVQVATIQNSTSSNVVIRLTLRTSTSKMLTLSPTSSAGGTYSFNLQQGGLSSKDNITNMAVFAQNSTGSPGTIFFFNFAINGAKVPNGASPASGCLSFSSPPPGGGCGR